MFAFMWIAAAFSAAGWIVHFYLACASRKEQKAEKQAHQSGVHEKSGGNEVGKGIRRRFGFAKVWKKERAGEMI